MRAAKIYKVLSVIFGVVACFADISHFLPQDYASLFHQFPTQQIHYFQTTGDGLYVPPAEIPISTSRPTTTTTEFTLPEVVDNRQAKDLSNFIPLRQHYLPPAQPPVREDTPYNYERPTAPTRKPDAIVVFEPPNTLPGYNYEVPQIAVISTPAPVYLPPAELTKMANLQHKPSTAAQSEFLLKIKEMRCLQQQAGYFRALLQLNKDLKALALLESESFDKRCQIKQTRDTLVVDISAENFQLCGVKNCGSDLCLRLRFPLIPGIRTANDGLVTLHCKSQERVAAKILSLKMSVANDIQARSLGNYFHGGSQNTFRTHVELLRRSSDGFTRALKTNEAVQLGEELLLRAHVLPGDGWNFTKLTDVTLQRGSVSEENTNAVEFISAEGCLNPAMQTICAQPAKFDPPLGHTLAFKAVMFQGMHSGDALILSMRITGCLEAQDCEQQGLQCNSEGLRRRRQTTTPVETTAQNNSQAASEISLISFRVVFEDKEQFTQEAENIKITEHRFALVVSLCFVATLIGLGIFMRLKFLSMSK